MPQMHIRKTYNKIVPEMLYEELGQALTHQGCIIDEDQSYKSTYKTQDGSEAMRASVVANIKTATRIKSAPVPLMDEKEEVVAKARITGTRNSIDNSLIRSILHVQYRRGNKSVAHTGI